MSMRKYFKKKPTPEELIKFIVDQINNPEHEPLDTTDQCRGEYYSPVVSPPPPESNSDQGCRK